MSLLLGYIFLVILARNGARALPIRVAAIDRLTSDACAGSSCRTVWDIVWSCLVTISLCTWTASHPNMPGPEHGKVIIGFFRAWLAMDSLLTPELVIVWAIQQWFVARKSAKDMNGAFASPINKCTIADVPVYLDPRWTTTHGYFVSMGGFMLHGCPDRLDHPLTPDELVFLVQKGYIDVPSITKKEIDDKSKGDLVSKGITIAQTGWFIMQCLARRIRRLPVAELELVTLAFAVTNTMTYLFWWNKPLNSECTVPVNLKKSISDEDWQECVRFIQIPEILDDGTPVIEGEGEEGGVIEMRRSMEGAGGETDSTVNHETKWHPTKGGRCWPIFMFESARTSPSREWNLRTTKKRVHRQYSGFLPPHQLLISFLVGGASAVTFGGIHCIAWSFAFPSYAERILWRIGCIIIMGVPVLLAVIFGVLMLFWKGMRPFRPVVREVVDSTRYAYILARVIMLVIALIALRFLPPGVSETVSWVTFIPHI